MAYEFRLPDIGEGLTEAEIVRWTVAVGDTVAVDETVVEVETDKAVVEIPAPFGGVVLHHGASEGEIVEVGEILVVIGAADERWDGEDGVVEAASEDQEGAEDDEVGAPDGDDEEGGEGSVEVGSGDVSDDEEVAPIVGTLSGDVEELTARSVGEGSKDVTSVQALPLVRKLAREHGIDITRIEGTGPDGRITRDDVMAHAGSDSEPVAVPSEAPPVPAMPEPAPETIPAGKPGGSERVRLSKLRRTIADHMSRSWAEIPHVTTFDEVDATRLLDLRAALQRRHDMSIPIEALIIKAVVPVLAEFPEFNATLDGDELVLHRRYDVGVALDTPDGLLVGVVKDARRRSVLGLSEEVRRLGRGARERSLDSSELGGQTFTVSNIGALGGGFGTPIVPHDTTAILSVGRAVDTPVARAGRVEIAPVAPLSLSYDHRVVDGGLGRRFMATVLENLAEPGLFLA